MLFSSLTYILIFMPIIVGLYFILPTLKARNIYLIIVSFVFYAWGEPYFIVYLLMLSVVNFLLVRWLFKSSSVLKRVLFFVIIFLNIGSLLYFKYTNFGIYILNSLGITSLKMLDLPLPLGLSFYTFMFLSYVFDVNSSKIDAEIHFFDFLLYVFYFPKLIQGPITRYADFKSQLVLREDRFSLASLGLERFIVGLAKKIIIANQVALISEYVFKMDINALTTQLVWIGSIAYTIQIYFDFSGYTDMALGVSMMFGIKLPENFNFPYMATSITDFWRRWHQSLSTWFRDYVYIPLGGNRVSKLRWYINILIVWALTGLWHGSNWNFVAWGLYFAFILIIEKQFLLKWLNKLPLIRNIYSLVLINIGWIIFNSRSLDQISQFVHLLFKPLVIDLPKLQEIGFGKVWIYFILGIIFSIDYSKLITDNAKNSIMFSIFTKVSVTLLFIISILMLVNSSYNPFIYFKF